jgi:hypothetical protein
LSAWLILRFVDPSAEFLFLSAGQSAPANAIPFGIPGVMLASHDEESTTFQRILTRYNVEDPALAQLAAIVTNVVHHVMDDRGSQEAVFNSVALGLLAVTEGIMLISTSDEETLRRCTTLYDALYARIQAQSCIDALMSRPPATVLEQTEVLAKAAERQRLKICLQLSFENAAELYGKNETDRSRSWCIARCLVLGAADSLP